MFIQDAKIALPGHKRDRLKRITDRFREGLLANLRSAEVQEVVTEMEVDEGKLRDDRVVLNAVRKLTERSRGADALSRLNVALQQAEGADEQWDIDDLRKGLKDRVRSYKRPKIGYMGVANVDLFWHDNNFIFGVGSSSGYGVMSYHRFTADFNRETPNRQRLVSRALKQALSTAGFIFGVPRCSDPRCARAYPNSLAEHDAKSTKLCDSCREGFRRSSEPREGKSRAT